MNNESTQTVPASVSSNNLSLQAFLPQFEAGTSGFVNGDAALWKEQASHRDDVTLFGGWGTYKCGWDEVGPHYDWAAARFRESGARVQVEYISSNVSGELAYTVAIERSESLVIGQDAPAPIVLRVTHIFRNEGGSWKLVHRHADPILDITRPDEVLQNTESSDG
jgi:ketosteroid isomerase-like protein